MRHFSSRKSHILTFVRETFIPSTWRKLISHWWCSTTFYQHWIRSFSKSCQTNLFSLIPSWLVISKVDKPIFDPQQQEAMIIHGGKTWEILGIFSLFVERQNHNFFFLQWIIGDKRVWVSDAMVPVLGVNSWGGGAGIGANIYTPPPRYSGTELPICQWNIGAANMPIKYYQYRHKPTYSLQTSPQADIEMLKLEDAKTVFAF